MDTTNISNTLKRYWQLAKAHPVLLCLSFGGVILGAGSNVVVLVIIKNIVDTATTVDISQIAFSEISWLLLPFLVVEIANMLCWRIAIYAMSKLEPMLITQAAEENFSIIHKHSFDFFSNEFVGSLVKKVTKFGRSIESFFDIMIFDMTQMFTRLVIAVVLLAIVSPMMGGIMLAWAVAFIWFNYRASLYKLKRFDVPMLEAESTVTAQLADSISNSANVKLFATRYHEQDRFNDVSRDWKDKATKAWFFSNHIEFIQNIMMIALEMILLYIALRLWYVGSISIGDFVLIQAYLLETFTHVWDFGRNVVRMYEALADAEEMTTIVNTPHDVKDIEGAKTLTAESGKVEYNNVTFSYHEGEHVLSNLNLSIHSGETVALIGPSGGGKTTIVKLLLRLYDIDAGTISIDRHNITDVTQDSLRRNIALVPQDPILFHRTLMENIRYGNLSATDEEVHEAAKRAHAHDFITKFSKGYQTMVGERGVKLSGGERQRIAIARAMLSPAKILILDEATSNLDVHSEELIQQALKELMKDKTTIIIAHRLSTVRHVDRIIVVEDGKIVEEGNHKELTEINGLYAQLSKLSLA